MRTEYGNLSRLSWSKTHSMGTATQTQKHELLAAWAVSVTAVNWGPSQAWMHFFSFVLSFGFEFGS